MTAVRIQPKSTLGRFRAFKGERVVLTQLAWTTILNVTNVAGWAAKLTLALFTEDGVSPDVWQNFRIRVTFDGATIPQMGQEAGVSLGMFFFMLRGSPYRVPDFGTDANDNLSFGGHVRFPMPLRTGMKVELYTPEHTGTFTVAFCNVEMQQDAPSPLANLPGGDSHRLYLIEQYKNAAQYEEVVLADFAGPSLVKAFLQDFVGSTGSTTYLEGNHKFYDGQALAQSGEDSGTEDGFDDSFYFADGVFHENLVGLLYKSGATVTAYRNFDFAHMPNHLIRQKLTWINGESGLPPGTTKTRWAVWAYLTAAPTYSNFQHAPAAPTSVAAAISSGHVDVTWTASDDPDVKEYLVYRNGGTTAIATVPFYTLTYRDATVGATYIVKANNFRGQLSAASNTATATNAMADQLVVDLRPGGIVNSGGFLSGWTDNTANHNNGVPVDALNECPVITADGGPCMGDTQGVAFKINDAATLTPTAAEWTISFRFRPHVAYTFDINGFVKMGNNPPSSPYEWDFLFFHGGFTSVGGGTFTCNPSLRIAPNGDGTGFLDINAGVAINVGDGTAFHTMTVVVSATAGNTKFYLDGVLKSTVNSYGRPFNGGAALVFALFGALNYWQMWNRALSGAEVAQLPFTG